MSTFPRKRAFRLLVVNLRGTLWVNFKSFWHSQWFWTYSGGVSKYSSKPTELVDHTLEVGTSWFVLASLLSPFFCLLTLVSRLMIEWPLDQDTEWIYDIHGTVFSMHPLHQEIKKKRTGGHQKLSHNPSLLKFNVGNHHLEILKNINNKFLVLLSLAWGTNSV